MSTDIRLPPKWIELNISKRECMVYIPSIDDADSACQCGRSKSDHPVVVQSQHYRPSDAWLPSTHTRTLPTDAYGTIIFEGEHHPNKSHFVRLSHDTNPELVTQLMTMVWGLPMPKLLITVRGSNTNFDLPARLGRILQVGLLKAAKTTGAWIITSGLNRGVAKHVGTGLGNQRTLGFKRGRIVSVGICPFGIIHNREVLIGRNRDRIYNPLEVSSSKYMPLNPKHSSFLLVDNGTVGKLGAESVFRRRLEKCIASYPISPNRGCTCPIVCFVIGGSFNTLRNITDYLYDEPPVPVVLFYGTGITADLLTATLKKVSGGTRLDQVRSEICDLMVKLYQVTPTQCDVLFEEIKKIVNRKNLITVFNASSPDTESFDAVLLGSLFRSQHWTPSQQLSLTLVWDRVDIATNEVFVYGRDWSRESLEHAMMEALCSDRLDFVELLIEHGLNMQIFLTPHRLEELYSLDRSNSIVMRTLLFEVAKLRSARNKLKAPNAIFETDLTLHDIGFAMSHMMGHVYKSRYSTLKKRKRAEAELDKAAETAMSNVDVFFTQPFDDLFIWAILTKRHNMAVLLWKHGVGALAKALVAVRLNKYLVEEFKSAEKTETNLAAEFQAYALAWETFAYSLLDTSFKVDCQLTRQLLTMELEHWSKETCLTLAVIAGHRTLLGHPCCQILLADLWMGALHQKHITSVKVFGGLLFPPFALFCDFKTRDELKLLPHQSKNEGGPIPISDENALDRASFETFSKSKASLSSSIFLQRFRHNAAGLESGESTEETTPFRFRSPRKFGHRPPGPHSETDMHFKKHLRDKEDPVFVFDDLGKPGGHGHHVTIIDDITSEDSLDRTTDEKRRGNKVKMVHVPKHGSGDRDLTFGNSYVTTRQELGVFRKLYEFQQAPMINFYRHTIGYLIFLSCLSYVILVPQSTTQMGYVEMYTVGYLIGLGCEVVREFICIDGYGWSQKWNQLQAKNWSLQDFLVVCISLVGTGCRMYPTSDKGVFRYGMLIYKVSSIYWNLRLYKYLSNHKWMGPKLVMITRMLKHMIYFAMILLVVMIAFGISRESIRFPDTYPTWKRISEAFLEPYVMFYGEIDIDALSPQCGDASLDQHECPAGFWIIPITWAIYMMVANILLGNVLIAVFNGIYAEVDAVAIELWMFQRFNFVMEFQSKPLLPPPFIALSHLYYVMRYLCFKCRSGFCDADLDDEGLDIDKDGRTLYVGSDRGLKTFPSPTEAARAFDFEEENLDSISTHPINYTLKPPLLLVDTEVPRRGGGKGDYSGHLDTVDLSQAPNINELIQKVTDINTELENQKVKLDLLLGYMAEDEPSTEPPTRAREV